MELEVTYVDKKNVAMILSFNISIPRCQTEAHIKEVMFTRTNYIRTVDGKTILIRKFEETNNNDQQISSYPK